MSRLLVPVLILVAVAMVLALADSPPRLFYDEDADYRCSKCEQSTESCTATKDWLIQARVNSFSQAELIQLYRYMARVSNQVRGNIEMLLYNSTVYPLNQDIERLLDQDPNTRANISLLRDYTYQQFGYSSEFNKAQRRLTKQDVSSHELMIYTDMGKLALNKLFVTIGMAQALFVNLQLRPTRRIALIKAGFQQKLQKFTLAMRPMQFDLTGKCQNGTEFMVGITRNATINAFSLTADAWAHALIDFREASSFRESPVAQDHLYDLARQFRQYSQRVRHTPENESVPVEVDDELRQLVQKATEVYENYIEPVPVHLTRAIEQLEQFLVWQATRHPVSAYPQVSLENCREPDFNLTALDELIDYGEDLTFTTLTMGQQAHDQVIDRANTTLKLQVIELVRSFGSHLRDFWFRHTRQNITLRYLSPEEFNLTVWQVKLVMLETLASFNTFSSILLNYDLRISPSYFDDVAGLLNLTRLHMPVMPERGRDGRDYFAREFGMNAQSFFLTFLDGMAGCYSEYPELTKTVLDHRARMQKISSKADAVLAEAVSALADVQGMTQALALRLPDQIETTVQRYLNMSAQALALFQNWTEVVKPTELATANLQDFALAFFKNQSDLEASLRLVEKFVLSIDNYSDDLTSNSWYYLANKLDRMTQQANYTYKLRKSTSSLFNDYFIVFLDIADQSDRIYLSLDEQVMHYMSVRVLLNKGIMKMFEVILAARYMGWRVSRDASIELQAVAMFIAKHSLNLPMITVPSGCEKDLRQYYWNEFTRRFAVSFDLVCEDALRALYMARRDHAETTKCEFVEYLQSEEMKLQQARERIAFIKEHNFNSSALLSLAECKRRIYQVNTEYKDKVKVQLNLIRFKYSHHLKSAWWAEPQLSEKNFEEMQEARISGTFSIEDIMEEAASQEDNSQELGEKLLHDLQAYLGVLKRTRNKHL